MIDDNTIWKHLKTNSKEGFENDVLSDNLKKIKMRKENTYENFTNNETLSNIHEPLENKNKNKNKNKKKKPNANVSESFVMPTPMIAHVGKDSPDEDDDYDGGEDKHFANTYGENSLRGKNSFTISDFRDSLIELIEFGSDMFKFSVAFISFIIVRTLSGHSTDGIDIRRNDSALFFKDMEKLLTGKMGTKEFIADVKYVSNKLGVMFSILFAYSFTYVIYFVTFYSEYNGNMLDGRGVMNIWNYNSESMVYELRKKTVVDETVGGKADTKENDYADRIMFEPFISYSKLIKMFCDGPSDEEPNTNVDTMQGGGFDDIIGAAQNAIESKPMVGDAPQKADNDMLSDTFKPLKLMLLTIIYYLLIGPAKVCEYTHWFLLTYLPNVFLGNIGILPIDNWFKSPGNGLFGNGYLVSWISQTFYSNASLFLILLYYIFGAIYQSGDTIKESLISGLKMQTPSNLLGVYVFAVSTFVFIGILIDTYRYLYPDGETELNSGGIGPCANLATDLPKTPFLIPQETPDMVKASTLALLVYVPSIIIINIIILLMVLGSLYFITPIVFILYIFSLPLFAIYKTTSVEKGSNIFLVLLKYVLPFSGKTQMQERIDMYCKLNKNEIFNLKYLDLINEYILR
jgi:hypothetical protein